MANSEFQFHNDIYKCLTPEIIEENKLIMLLQSKKYLNEFFLHKIHMHVDVFDLYRSLKSDITDTSPLISIAENLPIRIE